MVIVPGKFIFLCTPRTGSRSVSSALRAIPDVVIGPVHHAHPKDILEAQNKTGLPTITIIREPCRQLLSYFWPQIVNGSGRSFKEYVETQPIIPDHFQFNGAYRLNIYEEITDHFHLFEKGLEAFFDHWGLSNLNLPLIGTYKGAKKPDPAYITRTFKEIVGEYFGKDLALYRKVRAG